MNDWKEYKLGDVANVQTGPFGSQLHMSDYKPTGTPIITVEHLGDNKVLHKNLPLVGDEDKNRLKKYTLKKGDIVFSRVGSVDRCAYISEQEDGWMFSGRLLRVRVNEGIIYSRYLSYYFSQFSFKETIRMIAVGATMPSINTSLLSEVDITLPPLPTQKAIATILSRLDAKIDLLHHQNQTLEQLAETLFRKWFVEDAKEDWEMGSFSKWILETVGGEWGKENLENDFNKAVNCIRGTDIADLITGLPLKTPIRFVKEKKFENIQPKEGDLIIEISGGTDNQSTGRVCYINDDVQDLFDYPIVFSNFCRMIRIKRKDYSFFLYCYLQFLYNQGEFFNLENGSSGIKNLDYKALLNQMEFKMPNENEVISFNKKIKPLFKKQNQNKKQIKTLTQLRDSLLPQLMSGTVRVK
ncbi:MAG: restriction endonuclease subunit S [Chitinophagaceae bacterium]|nr:restriction endonuclease subunit S [Chitinophagaceae bacterium]